MSANENNETFENLAILKNYETTDIVIHSWRTDIKWQNNNLLLNP